jgi:hypothetical protein
MKDDNNRLQTRLQTLEKKLFAANGSNFNSPNSVRSKDYM